MDFATEIREAFEKKYIKVFLKESDDIELVKSTLEQIKSIHKVNITESHSGGNDSLTLTIYPKKMCTAESVEKDIKKYLSGIDLGKPNMGNVEKIQVLGKLDNCPKAKKLFNQAIEKRNMGCYERNTLDDMRLSLELFLKQKLGNNQSLENQIKHIGQYQKEKGRSAEFTNMFRSLLDYYSKYQNEHVKHDDNINQGEVDFVIKLTSDFIDCF